MISDYLREAQWNQTGGEDYQRQSRLAQSWVDEHHKAFLNWKWPTVMQPSAVCVFVSCQATDTYLHLVDDSLKGERVTPW